MEIRPAARLMSFLVIATLLAGLGAAPALAQSPAPTPAPEFTWRGYIVDQHKIGGFFGGIVVTVPGMHGLPVQIESEGGLKLQGSAGTAPKFGADACEFPAMKPDLYYVSLPTLGVSIQLTVPQGEVVFVEFVPGSADSPGTKLSVIRLFNYGPDPVRLTIDEKEFNLEAQAPLVIRLHPGTYSYSISSPAFETLNSQATFKPGYWTWTVSQESYETTVKETGIEGPLPSGDAVSGERYRDGLTPVPTPAALPVTGVEESKWIEILALLPIALISLGFALAGVARNWRAGMR
jgi:hypothetical protein